MVAAGQVVQDISKWCSLPWQVLAGMPHLGDERGGVCWGAGVAGSGLPTRTPPLAQRCRHTQLCVSISVLLFLDDLRTNFFLCSFYEFCCMDDHLRTNFLSSYCSLVKLYLKR